MTRRLRRPAAAELALGSFILLLAAVAVSLRLDQPTLIDETEYHIRAIAVFIAQFPAVDIRDFGGVGIASGPVPYILWSAWGRLLGIPASLDTIAWFRLVTVLASMVGIGAVWKMADDVPAARQFLLIGLIVLTPYYFLGSFTIYTQMIALTFGLTALASYRSYVQTSRAGHLLAAVLLASLAVASRQVFLSYAAGLLAHHALGPWLARWTSATHATTPARTTLPDTYWRDLALLLLPIGTLLALFVVWGGSVPPPARSNMGAGGINWLQPNFALIFLGFWFLPVWLEELKTAPRLWIAVAALFALNLLFAPDYARTRDVVEGVLPSLFAAALDQGVPDLLVRLGQVVLCFGGAMVLYAILRRMPRHVEESWLALAGLAHLGVLMLVPLVWERYYLPVIPVLWLFLRRGVRAGWLYGPWLGLQAALTAVYFVYKLYLQ